MTMVDMKLPKKTEKELKTECYPVKMEQDEYPYGLKLNFETEQVDKLPKLEAMNPDERVTIVAEGCITRVDIEKRNGGKDRKSYCVQIEKIDVSPMTKGKKLEEMSMKEYKEARSK